MRQKRGGYGLWSACLRYLFMLPMLAVALFSGVIATILFFKATDLVKENLRQLAVIEATQSGEVLFTLLGGILIVVAGMIGNSLVSRTA